MVVPYNMSNFSEYKVRLYCCMIPYCDRSYSTKFNLKRHFTLCHTEEKRFYCLRCDKYFASQQNLREHIYTHTGAKPYKCSICSENFRQFSQLSLHKRNHVNSKNSEGYCLEPNELGNFKYQQSQATSEE